MDRADGAPPSAQVASPLTDPAFIAGLRPIPSGDPGQAPDWPAVDVRGTRPDGTDVAVDLAAVGSPLLLVFLTARCDGCATFWSGLAGGTDPELSEVRPVVVTRGSGTVDPSEIADLASGFRGEVVMSDPAWTDYRVTGYPFLVLVDPAGRRILAETVGFDWADVRRLIRSGLGS